MKLPISIQDNVFLVAADAELICKTESATPEELQAIVDAVNRKVTTQYTLMMGNVVDGFVCRGLYASRSEAIEAGDSVRDDWCVMEIEPVEED